MGLKMPDVAGLGLGLLTWVRRCARVAGVALLPGLLCLLSACSTPPAKSGVGALKMPPRSRYILQVSELVDKQWHLYLKQRPTDAAFGGMEMGYWVNPKGKVVKMRMVGANGASPDLVRLTTNAIQDVDLPRMPADVVSTLTAKDEGVLKLIYKAYVPPSKGGTGAALDARLTPAERDTRESRVQWNKEHVRTLGYGPDSKPLDLKETPTNRYGKLVVGRVKRQWTLYLMQSKVPAVGVLDVVFYVNSQGKVENLEATPQKGCDPGLTALTVRAVRDAEIPPMPAEVRSALSGKNRGRLKILYHARGR